MHGPHGFRSGLRFFVLILLSGGPKSGYEIAKELEARTGWRPSPGSLYPLLFKLEAAGFIKKNEDGLYELTDSGRYSILGPAFELFSPEILLTQAEIIVELLLGMKQKGVKIDKKRLEKIRNGFDELLE